MASTAPTSDLSGWKASPFTGAGHTHPCYEKGAGPGVVVVPEAPGVTPEVLGLGQHLVDEGFTVVIPSLFGTPGRKPTGAYIASVLPRLCIASEFRAFATNAHRPIADYLRAVSSDLAGRTPGAGVGIIGMCFTGGFALAAAVDEVVSASVVSQPSVPFPLGAARRGDPGLSVDELARVVTRTRQDGLCVLGLRFTGDKISSSDRFATLRAHLGAAFEIIEVDSLPGNPGGFGPRAHSVLTSEVREEPPNLALAARQRVVEFLRERLVQPQEAS